MLAFGSSPWGRVLLAAACVATAACGARGGLQDLDASALLDASVADEGVPDAGMDSATADSGDDAMMDAAADSSPPEVSDIGEPCSGPDACMSAEAVSDVPACIERGVWPNGHLWEDGYCTAQCTPSTRPEEGEPLARDDCPFDALCLRVEGGVGVCLLACEDDGDCRMPSAFSYSCRRSFGAGAPGEPVLAPIGVCASAHCQSRGCIGSARCDC